MGSRLARSCNNAAANGSCSIALVGQVEIGDQEMFGFVARALDYGGLTFEDDKPDTLAEALAALEKGLAEYFQREGVEREE
jgi:hypothetical protein